MLRRLFLIAAVASLPAVLVGCPGDDDFGDEIEQEADEIGDELEEEL